MAIYKTPREANYVGQNQSTRLTPAQSRRTKHKEQLGATGGPLLSQQFQPMSAVKRMAAVDSPTVASLIPAKQEQVAAGEGDTEDYPALIHTMRTGGPQSIPPVHVDTISGINQSYGGGRIPHLSALSNQNRLALGNGGHRTAIAHDLGWKVMPVTSYKEESGYGDPEYLRENYGSDESGSYRSSSSSQSASNAASSAASSSLNPGDRSFVPHHTDAGGRDPGARWHAHGRDAGHPPGEGLYSQLHGPAPRAAAAPLSANLSQQQFARTRMGGQPTWQRDIKAVVAEGKNEQPRLPGMDIAKYKPGPHGPEPAQFTGGNASEGPMATHFPGGGRIMTGDRGTTEQRVIRGQRSAPAAVRVAAAL